MERTVMITFPLEDFQSMIIDCMTACLKNAPPEKVPDLEEPDILKIAEVAKLTGYKPGYIYELVSKRAIPFHKVRNSLRFSKKEVEAWIKADRPNLLQKAVERLTEKTGNKNRTKLR